MSTYPITSVMRASLCAIALCSGMAALPAHASDNKEAIKAIAESIGAKKGSTKMAPLTVDQLKDAAAPGKDSDAVYVQKYQALLAANKAGAALYIWQHFGAPEAYGYAAIKDGKLVARLTMAIN